MALVFTLTPAPSDNIFSGDNPTSGSGGSISITRGKEASFLSAPAVVPMSATSASGFNVTAGRNPVRDPAYHDITYIWKVRGAPLSDFTAPTNLVTAWNNPNVMIGPEVAFYFPDPGTYTVDLLAVDSAGTTAVASTTVTVESASATNTRYTGTRTVCFSTGSDFTGAPSGARQVTVSSLSDITTWTNTTHSNPMRFLFKRGDTFTNLSGIQVRANAEYFGAWGSGAKPILEENGSASGAGMFDDLTGSQHTFVDLDIRGAWNASNATGTINSLGPFYARAASRGTSTSCINIVRCEFDGLSTVEIRTDDSTANTVNWSLTDCVITNWAIYGAHDFGAYASGSATKRVYFIGTRIMQNVDATDQQTGNGGYGFRCTSLNLFVASQFDGFTRHGWSASAPAIYHQPSIRLNTNAGTNTCYANLDRVVTEGGGDGLKIEPSNGTTQEYAGNYLLDRVMCVGSAASTNGHIRTHSGGTTIRNFYGVMPAVPDYHNSWTAAIELKNANVTAENRDSEIEIYNSTHVNLQSAAQSNGSVHYMVENTGGFTSVVGNRTTGGNNVVHAPDVGTGAVSADDPIDETTSVPGFTPRFKGIKTGSTMDTTYSSVGKTIPLPRPQTGSAAIDDGDTGKRVYADFLGDVRPSTGNERGALLES